MLSADLRHIRDESWLLKGKGWIKSSEKEREEVEFGGETEALRGGI